MDFNVYGPDGTSVHKEESVSETEIAGTGNPCGCGLRAFLLVFVCMQALTMLVLTNAWPCLVVAAAAVTAEGGQGPWRACFRVSKGQVQAALGSTVALCHLLQLQQPDFGMGGVLGLSPLVASCAHSTGAVPVVPRLKPYWLHKEVLCQRVAVSPLFHPRACPCRSFAPL